MTMYFRSAIGKCLIGYFSGGPQEKFYRNFTAVMIKVAYGSRGAKSLSFEK